jgi:acetyl esterase/lipase
MPLDRHAKRLLDMVAMGGAPSAAELSPTAMREAMLRLAKSTDASDTPVGDVAERSIPGAGGPLRVRIYSPIGSSNRALPGLVYFHGGMGVFSDIETHDGVCRMLTAASNCRLLSVDYRLAPEHPFPAAVDDAFAATRWAFECAADLGLDPTRIGVAGDSAGGTLAIVVCLLARDVGAPRIALQALLCPVTDLSRDSTSRVDLASGYFIDRSVLEWAKRLYCSPAVPLDDPRVSPLRARNFAALPPALVHTAEFDPVRDEGQAYADALSRAGVPVDYACHAGMIHNFYCMARAIPAARTIVSEIGVEIGRRLAAGAEQRA